MHFVLRCLHRYEDMDAEKKEWAKEEWMTVPFCQNRHEKTHRDEKTGKRAVELALKRLEEIRNIIDNGALQGLWSNQVATFDLRPENELRQELEELRAESTAWMDERAQVETEKERLVSDIRMLEVQKEERDSELRKLNQLTDELRGVYDKRTDSINRALARLQGATWIEFLRNRQALLDEIAEYFLQAASTKVSMPDGGKPLIATDGKDYSQQGT